MLGIFRHIIVSSLKLGKYERHWFSHDIGQNVETSSMGHANNKGVCAQFGRPINGILQCGHNGLATVQSKALGGVEFLGQEVLKRVGKAETLKNVLLLLLVVPLPAGIFDALSNPIALVLIANVHVLHSQCATVGLTKLLDDSAERDLSRRVCQFFQIALVSSGRSAQEIQWTVHVLLAEAVVGRLQFFRVVWAKGKGEFSVEIEGIEIGSQVSIHLVGANEV
jgi:hypothetical protein